MQRLLFPDPRPLVETLGPLFFRQAPERPGVYMMRDDGGTVLYVGKAKNLRKRLASYRVANPDRMPRRHLRLLRAVRRIDLQECSDESAALAREAELLLSLRPRFNRAGTWKGSPRYLSWKMPMGRIELAVFSAPQDGWQSCELSGLSASMLRGAISRLLWCALHPETGLRSLPEGWFYGKMGEVAVVPTGEAGPVEAAITHFLAEFFAGCADPFVSWLRTATQLQTHPFEVAVHEADLDTVTRFAGRFTSVGLKERAVPHREVAQAG